MDKEQQIEEIAKIICNTCREKHIGVSKNCKCRVGETCIAADIHSEELYNAGYRKVVYGRDSFVDLLNKEIDELTTENDKDEKIKKLQADNEILSIQNKNLEIAFDRLEVKNERLSEKLKQVLLSIDTVKEMNAMCNIDEHRGQAVKEFAEKIKGYINDKVMEDFDDSDSVKYYTIDLDEFESKLDELVKEYENDK